MGLRRTAGVVLDLNSLDCAREPRDAGCFDVREGRGAGAVRLRRDVVEAGCGGEFLFSSPFKLSLFFGRERRGKREAVGKRSRRRRSGRRRLFAQRSERVSS